MSIKNLPAGKNYPGDFYVVVEILKDSHNKYEYDEELETIVLDRVYYTTMTMPLDYGFIPQTRSEDGDHLDAFLLMDHSVFPGCVVLARAIGVLYMVDDGAKDEKIIAVPVKDPRKVHIQSVEDLSPHFKKELEHYLLNYKALEGKKVEITGWGGKEEALEMLNKSLEK